jgi:pimeloyl-ACP methyl ester carboxylesterase
VPAQHCDRAVSADLSEVLLAGPWQHRFVSANGARFHVAEAGEGPLVLLLHGYPQFWWCWRHQLPALAEAGYRAVAMDLRGYGGSDKPPRGYDTTTFAADVAGVIRALGQAGGIVVGHDWGGWTAWSMPALQPRVTRAICAVSMAHPLTLRSAAMHRPRQRRAVAAVLPFQLPFRPERRLAGGIGVDAALATWSGPGFPDPESVRRYRRAMQLPFVAHTSMESYRWAVRSLPRRDGRSFAAAIDSRIEVPVLQVQGGLDPLVLPETAAASSRWVHRNYRYELLPEAGHFVPEEAPERLNAVLLDWLAGLPR